MNKYTERIYNGIIKENPTFVIMLGMCPTLAVTTSGLNGMNMGLTTTVVLAMSNFLISALRKAIPDKVRIPAYIVVVASLVTIVQLLLEAYLPAINKTLGIYIPLIVVNCIILGRAEAFAAKNTIGVSFFDGIGMGLGFTAAITIIGSIREFLGAGTLFNIKVTPASFEPITIFILAPGAFFVLSVLTALQNKLKLKSATNVPGAGNGLACGGDCSHCGGSICTTNREKLEESIEPHRLKEEIAAAKMRSSHTVDTMNSKNNGKKED